MREELEAATYLPGEDAGDALREEGGISAHVGGEPLGDVSEHAEREVLGDELTVVGAHGQIVAVVVDDGLHDGAQLLVEEDLEIFRGQG